LATLFQPPLLGRGIFLSFLLASMLLADAFSTREWGGLVLFLVSVLLFLVRKNYYLSPLKYDD